MSQEHSIKALKKICDQYDLTIAKVTPDSDGGTDVFVYSKDERYVNDFLAPQKLMTNKVETFYNKDISIRPLEELKNNGVEGKYALHIRGTDSIDQLSESINSAYQGELTVYPNSNQANTFTGVVDQLRYGCTFALVGVLTVMLLIHFLYTIRSRKKEIAIKRLSGHSTGAIFHDIFQKEVLIPFAYAAVCSELAAVLIFALKHNITSTVLLWRYLGGSTKVVLLVGIGLMVILALFLLFNIANGSRELNLTSSIKGRGTSGSMLSVVVKVGSTLSVIILFTIAFTSWNFVADKKDSIQRWEETKEYATLNLYIPEYINENYIQSNPIMDTKGNPIQLSEQLGKDGLYILIPEQYKPYESELKQILHQKHVFDKYIAEDIHREWISGEKNQVDLSKQNIDNPAITETFLYIQNNQALFTYTVGGDFVANGIFAVVNAEEVSYFRNLRVCQ